MKRLRSTILVGVLALGLTASLGGPAMATKGNCNPAPDPYNVIQLSKGNGDVFVEVGWGWDGVSVFPNCAGPIVGARVSNKSLVTTWYARFPYARGGDRAITIPPNSVQTYSASQLASVGLLTLDDITEVQLSLTP